MMELMLDIENLARVTASRNKALIIRYFIVTNLT